MNEIHARRTAANLTDPLSRAAIAAQLTDVQALLAGIRSGLRDGQPDGMTVRSSAESQISSAQGALRHLADTIAGGNEYVGDTAEAWTAGLHALDQRTQVAA